MATNWLISFARDGSRPHVKFSACGRYRYLLAWPTKLNNNRVMLVIGANPSKAGRLDSPGGFIMTDPYISRMVNLASKLGYGWLWAVNARSWVSTDPKGVPPDPEGIGIATDSWISAASREADLVICCYGRLAGDRGPHVLELVRAAGKAPYALALTKDGLPRHPRGVPSSARPFPL